MYGGFWARPVTMRSLTRLHDIVSRHPLLADGFLAATSAGVSLALGRQEPPAGWYPFDHLAFVLTCVMNATLTARRRAPLGVLLAYSGLWAWYVAAGYWPVVNSGGAMLLLYTVAASRPVRVTIAVTLLFAVLWVYAGAFAQSTALVAVLAQSLVWPATLSYFGNGSRRLAERGRQLAEQAEQLRLDQEELARRAVIDERLRLARELHDVVAHHMSVISVQAGLARYVLNSDPPTAGSALDTVLNTSGEALHEMRRLLAVLRVEPGEDADEIGPREPYDPAPRLDRLGDLLDRVRQAGVPVALVQTGTRRPLSSGVEVCVYRVIQESLTNVLKHAGPASATVTLYYSADRIVARIVDDGRGPAGSGTGGHGLIGMAERAKLYGGTVTSGPCLPQGFEVVLAIPTSLAADVPAPPGGG